jgi:hypothetical protein
MLIDTSDPLWPRVATAFVGVTGPVPEGLTEDQFAQNRIMEFIKSVVRNYESREALKPSTVVVEAAVTKVEADFHAQFTKPVIIKDAQIDA